MTAAMNTDGGVRRVNRVGATTIRPLDTLVALFAVLVVVELALANLPAHLERDWPGGVRLLGTPTAALLLYSAIVLRFVRSQYALTIAPLLRPVSHWSATSELGGDSAEQYRVVLIKNVGTSAAVIDSVHWIVGGGERGATQQVRSLHELHEVLRALGFAEGRDYAIGNYSPGTALASGEQRIYFECTAGFASALDRFDAIVEFASLLGDRYEKSIPLLPQPGASTLVTTAAPRAVA